MKKLMALVLSVGLVLLGTAPVMAAGQALPTPAVSKDLSSGLEEIKIPEPPGTGTLSDEELEEVQGEWGPLAYLAARALVGAAVGAIGGAIKSYVDTGHINAKTVAAGAAIGLVTGLGGGAGALIPKP